MLAAARFGDEITHTEQRSGLIGGMILGALVGALLVAGTIATVLTGGLALAPILLIVGAVATGAAVGGGIFSFFGGMSTVPKGAINKAATTVFVNGILAARSCIDTALCQDHTLQPIMSGAATVYVEGFPFARVSDIGMCSFKISKGSPNVFVSEATAACPGYENIKPEVEPWLTNLHRVLGWVGGLCLMGPIYGLRVAVASLLGGEIGAYGGGEIGERLGGKWGRVAGSILGGIIGGGIPLRPKVSSFINRLEVDPNVLGTAGGNLRLRPQGSITYGELDELGRPTGVQATITRDMIGTGTPANKSITPPGWSGNGNTYNEARGHLLGNQLGGSGDDVRNLVTLQQRPANSPVMRDFETQVRRAVENGETVNYTSTPIYNGNNPVPRGVTLNGQGNNGYNLGVTILNPPGR